MDNIKIGEVYKYCQNFSKEDLKLIKKAYEFACKCHDGQYRQSGEPYIIHPLNVAFILARLNQGVNTICAGLLHDVVEDTYATVEMLEEEFNEDIATLVYGVTKIPDESFGTFRKFLVSGVEIDPRIIMIKLADRLHNMRTLEFKSEAKQREKAEETLYHYVPLAYMTGAYEMKIELEDLAFMYLEPNIYRDLLERKKVFEINNVLEISEVLTNIKKQLEKDNIKADTLLKTKNIYRIHRALEDRNTEDLEEIPSMVCLKIIVDDVMDCYKTLGSIHAMYCPVDQIVKDKIVIPGVNGYQSIHTTLRIPDGKMLQVHIRTKEMDKIADYGIFADSSKEEIKEKMENSSFGKQIRQFNLSFTDSKEFVESLENEVFTESVYAITPLGDYLSLPKGATIIDFAYKIHTDIGNELIGAKVNGQLVDINYVIKNMDRVTIIRDKEMANPDESWLEFVKTSAAREGIKRYIKKNNKIKKLKK